MITHKENFDHFIGDIVLDPFEGVDPTRTLNFESGVFVPNDPPGVYTVHNMAHYDGTLLSVHFMTDEWSRVEGTAVMIAPGFALAATHVIEPHIPDVMNSKRRMLCIGYTPSGSRLWRVGQIEKINGTDLMILSLLYSSVLPDDNRFVQTAVTTRLPALGEVVMIAGLRASDRHVMADEEMKFEVKDGHVLYGADVRIGVGEVTQHFLEGRGSMLPGPTIEVACSTPGGLSGGPAFDKNGRVIGILSSSLNHEDGRGPSFVSLLWPALVHQVKPFFLPKLFPPSIRLLEFEPCNIDRRDVVSWSIDENTGMTRVAYEAYT
jgi:hypothetical protein